MRRARAAAGRADGLQRRWVTSVFPGRESGPAEMEKPDRGKKKFEEIRPQLMGSAPKPDPKVLERGKSYRTINKATGDVKETYITQDGGRIDFVKDFKWPPEFLTVVEQEEEALQAKHGMPWPALYKALDIWQSEVSLRYKFAKSKFLDELVGSCAQCVAPDALRPLSLDDETILFVRRCIYQPDAWWRHWVYRKLVDYGVYRYAAGSLMSIPEMYHLSESHVEDLLSDYNGPRRRCLDVGAGLGDVSRRWKKHFEEYHCTEVSNVMVRDLKRKGFEHVHLTDSVGDPANLGGIDKFDCVVCMNVLDRCSDPSRLLHDMIKRVAPGGRLILSIPLPLRQVQYSLGEAQELLWPPPYNKEGAFEFAASWFARDILAVRYGGSQLVIRRICRAPYMCSGPAKAPLSAIDTAIFVLDKKEGADSYPPFKEWVLLSGVPRVI
eukprot:TRINITY_DN28194_c0_g1_i2.p1 TRINITY_DN28194_c0_g1~~TRINITY_DN28194_c0_g1_i2.p1  ORF type:complete len:451 (+),score=137.35 TRINITY_DN28194_c0_g1_i2:42-1355(+)